MAASASLTPEVLVPITTPIRCRPAAWIRSEIGFSICSMAARVSELLRQA
jgi:hypothetical protein